MTEDVLFCIPLVNVDRKDDDDDDVFVVLVSEDNEVVVKTGRDGVVVDDDDDMIDERFCVCVFAESSKSLSMLSLSLPFLFYSVQLR